MPLRLVANLPLLLLQECASWIPHGPLLHLVNFLLRHQVGGSVAHAQLLLIGVHDGSGGLVEVSCVGPVRITTPVLLRVLRMLHQLLVEHASCKGPCCRSHRRKGLLLGLCYQMVTFCLQSTKRHSARPMRSELLPGSIELPAGILCTANPLVPP